MTLLWTTPRVWVTKDPITKGKLNAVSDNLNYLINPSMDVKTVRGTGSDVSTTSTSPAVIDDTLLGVSVELTGAAPVRVKLMGIAVNNTLNAFTIFDMLYDSTNYLSSLTSTPLANGIGKVRQGVANVEYSVNFDIIIPSGVLAAGVHTFAPRFWVSSGTGTFRLATGWFAQVVAGEF